MDIICSERRTVFKDRSSRKTGSLEYQVMSPIGGYCAYNLRASENTRRIINQNKMTFALILITWRLISSGYCLEKDSSRS